MAARAGRPPGPAPRARPPRLPRRLARWLARRRQRKRWRGLMMAQPNAAGQLSWLLDNLVARVQHVRQAVVLSRDGLVVAASQNVSREDGDHLAALAAGVQSLARGATRQFAGGEVRQTIIEMEAAFL